MVGLGGNSSGWHVGGHPDIMEERWSERDAYCSVQACGAFGNYFFFYSDSWILSVVYNPQVLDGQVKVWNDLSKLARLQLPWVVTGDFNAVVRTEKHGGGASTIM